jgi:hypothetical protein
MDLTIIGTLAAATKGVVEAIKSVKDMIGARPSEPAATNISKLEQSFETYRKRIVILAEQLLQTETLTRMLPVWLKEHSQFEVWEEQPSDERLRELDSGLRRFIGDSIHDHFSGMFFRTSFDKLPTVPSLIDQIRSDLKALEASLDAIPHSNLPAWRIHLPIIKVRLNDLRVKAVKLDNLCDTLRGELVLELKDSA